MTNIMMGGSETLNGREDNSAGDTNNTTVEGITHLPTGPLKMSEALSTPDQLITLIIFHIMVVYCVLDYV